MVNSQIYIVSVAPLFLQGLWMTAKLLIGSALISFSIGTILGILNCAKLQTTWLSPIINGYVFVVRGIPVYVQVLIAYFVLPDILGINLPAYTAAIIALGSCSSGYVAEIVRGGINSIAQGQWEAAFTLGYSTRQTVWYIILPQMMHNVLPTFANELESLIKSTAIVSTIGVLELTRVGGNMVARYMNPVPVYLAIACLYLILSALLKITARIIEKKLYYVMR